LHPEPCKKQVKVVALVLKGFLTAVLPAKRRSQLSHERHIYDQKVTVLQNLPRIFEFQVKKGIFFHSQVSQAYTVVHFAFYVQKFTR
jgi:hypothetical protein